MTSSVFRAMVGMRVEKPLLGASLYEWLVYAEGLREQIELAIEKQDGAVREVEMGPTASAESLAADLKLAKTELRTLRAEVARLKTGIALLRETEAERDQLREALKETEEKLESALIGNHSPSTRAEMTPNPERSR